jgi:anti-anti-sigma regulatory factor
MTRDPIPFPVRGTFDWGALPGFTQRVHAVSTAESDRFRLDLGRLEFCEPVGLACLAAGIHYLQLREQTCIDVIRPERADVRSYLERLGLFEMLGEKDLYPYQRWSPDGRFVELTRLGSAGDVPDATTAVCAVIQRQFALPDQARRAIDTILSEIVENVFHHAQSPTGAYLCCQSYENRISAAIVDLGVGVRTRFSDTDELTELMRKHGGALRAAITPKVTSRPAHNSGYGLALASGLVRLNEGKLGIYSLTDRLSQNGAEVSEHEAASRWPGTVVTFTLYRENPLDIEALYTEVWPPDPEDGLDFFND